MRRVVVTGLGLLTPLGLGIDVNWKRLVSGFVGINKIENFDVSDLPCKIAGQIPIKDDDHEGGLDIHDWIEPREYKRIDRFIAYGLIAASQAIEDSGWQPKIENEKNRTGVILGSGIGGLETISNTSELSILMTVEFIPCREVFLSVLFSNLFFKFLYKSYFNN